MLDSSRIQIIDLTNDGENKVKTRSQEKTTAVKRSRTTIASIAPKE